MPKQLLYIKRKILTELSSGYWWRQSVSNSLLATVCKYGTYWEQKMYKRCIKMVPLLAYLEYPFIHRRRSLLQIANRASHFVLGCHGRFWRKKFSSPCSAHTLISHSQEDPVCFTSSRKELSQMYSSMITLLLLTCKAPLAKVKF